MAETLSFSEYARGVVTLVGRSTETLSCRESASGMIANHGRSLELLTFAERARGSLPIRGSSTEGIRCRESSRGVLWGRSREALSLSEAARGYSPISGTARESLRFGEHCYGTVAEPVSDDTTAWCINLATGGHSRYTGALDGSLSAVTGRVVTAASQLGSDRATYVPDLYVYGRLASDLTVVVTTDEQTERTYTLESDGREGMHRRRRKLAGGIKGNTWQFSLSGEAFTINSVEVSPVASRRVI